MKELLSEITPLPEKLASVPTLFIATRHAKTYQNAAQRQDLPFDEILRYIDVDQYVDNTPEGDWQAEYRTIQEAKLLLSHQFIQNTIIESNTVRGARLSLLLIKNFDRISSIPLRDTNTTMKTDPLVVEQHLGLSDPYYALRYPQFGHFLEDRKALNKKTLHERFFEKPVQIQQITDEDQFLIDELTRRIQSELLRPNGIVGESEYEVFLRAEKFWENQKRDIKPGSITIVHTHGKFMLYLWAVVSGIRINRDNPDGMRQALDQIEKFSKDPEHRIWNCSQMTYTFDPEKNTWPLTNHEIIDEHTLEAFKKSVNPLEMYV